MNKRIFFCYFILLCCLFLFSGTSYSAVEQQRWNTMSRGEKESYVQGIYDGEYYALRNVYLLDVETLMEEYYTRIPQSMRVTDSVAALNNFYKHKKNHSITVPWALFILSAALREMSPEKIELLTVTAQEDFAASYITRREP